jgi:hypothetical protein
LAKQPEDLAALYVERQPVEGHNLARRLVLTLEAWSKSIRPAASGGGDV